MFNLIKSTIQITILSIVFLFSTYAVIAAWSEPAGGPTGNNASTPLDVSSTGQTKIGGLILNTGAAANGLIVSAGNVGIGTTNPGEKLEVYGNVKLSNSAIPAGVRALTPTGFGYSQITYRVVQVGASSGTESVSIGYDPSGNASGNFSGDGREVLFRNGISFVTPNAANTGWYNPVLTMKDGNVGIGTTNPVSALDVVSGGTTVLSMGAWTAWTPTYSGFSINPTAIAKYTRVGKTVQFTIDMQTTAGTSNSTAFTWSLPTQASGTSGIQIVACRGYNFGGTPATPSMGYITPGATAVTMYLDFSGAAYGATGTKGALCSGSYEAN